MKYAAIILLLLTGCTTTQILQDQAEQACIRYRDTGSQSRVRLATDILTGYPVIRIFCTHDDAVTWAESLIQQNAASVPVPAQTPLTLDSNLIQTAGALILLPLDQRSALLNSYPPETRAALVAILPALERLRGNLLIR